MRKSKQQKQDLVVFEVVLEESGRGRVTGPGVDREVVAADVKSAGEEALSVLDAFAQLGRQEVHATLTTTDGVWGIIVAPDGTRRDASSEPVVARLSRRAQRRAARAQRTAAAAVVVSGSGDSVVDAGGVALPVVPAPSPVPVSMEGEAEHMRVPVAGRPPAPHPLPDQVTARVPAGAVGVAPVWGRVAMGEESSSSQVGVLTRLVTAQDTVVEVVPLESVSDAPAATSTATPGAVVQVGVAVNPVPAAPDSAGVGELVDEVFEANPAVGDGSSHGGRRQRAAVVAGAAVAVAGVAALAISGLSSDPATTPTAWSTTTFSPSSPATAAGASPSSPVPVLPTAPRDTGQVPSGSGGADVVEPVTPRVVPAGTAPAPSTGSGPGVEVSPSPASSVRQVELWAAPLQAGPGQVIVAVQVRGTERVPVRLRVGHESYDVGVVEGTGTVFGRVNGLASGVYGWQVDAGVAHARGLVAVS